MLKLLGVGHRIVDIEGQIIMARADILLGIAAIVILGTLMLMFKDILIESDKVDTEAEYQIMAITLLDKYIDQVALRSFDEASINGIPNGIPGSFTSKCTCREYIHIMGSKT